jgi:hypothetical protein
MKGQLRFLPFWHEGRVDRMPVVIGVVIIVRRRLSLVVCVWLFENLDPILVGIFRQREAVSLIFREVISLKDLEGNGIGSCVVREGRSRHPKKGLPA